MDLTAIRERDRAAEKCATCGYGRGGQHDVSLAKCEAMLRRAEKRSGKPRLRDETTGRLCWEPAAHHDFIPGGVSSWDGGDEDRRTLLALIDGYRQAFLDIATESGSDTSDLDHPDQLVTPPIEEYALREVRILRQSYEECLRDG